MELADGGTCNATLDVLTITCAGSDEAGPSSSSPQSARSQDLSGPLKSLSLQLVEAGMDNTTMLDNTSTLSSGKLEYDIDKSRQPATTLDLAGAKDGGMEVKTEAPVAGSATIGLTATDMAKSASPPPGLDASYPSGILQVVLIIALLLAMFLVALDMVRTLRLFPCPEKSAY